MQKLRELGIKLTPQRLAILTFLEGNSGHPSAEEIYSHVSKKYPSISLATVYNTLDRLKACGRLQELKVNDKRRHFDPDMRLHNHFICSSCRKIADVFSDFDLAAARSELKGFQISGSHVEFYGICPDCSRKTKVAGRTAG